MKRIVMMLVMGLLVSGCMEVLSKNSEGITISGPKFTYEDMYATAEEHCQSFSKNSLMILKERHVHTFECR